MSKLLCMTVGRKRVMSNGDSFFSSCWLGATAFQRHADDIAKQIMISNLMECVISPEKRWLGTIQDPSSIDVSSGRLQAIADAVGSWDFSAHQFDSNELVYAAFLMFDHALKMEALERWRLRSHDLMVFLMATRAAYNKPVIYHNFRHAVDVLQATFFFLLRIQALPPFPASDYDIPAPKSPFPLAAMLEPLEVLTLLISAIGHDVGHPGVNNKFLIKVKAPIACIYSNRSVLESFHSAAFSQILHQTWGKFYEETEMLGLMTSAILATDMAVHNDYIHTLDDLRSRSHLQREAGCCWQSPDLCRDKRSLCGLLLKCADISNVARVWDIACPWTELLQNEFLEQGRLEEAAGIETALPGGPPDPTDRLALAKGQIGFIQIFAGPLFRGISDLLPSLVECVTITDMIQNMWKAELGTSRPASRPVSRNGWTSPGATYSSGSINSINYELNGMLVPSNGKIEKRPSRFRLANLFKMKR